MRPCINAAGEWTLSQADWVAEAPGNGDVQVGSRGGARLDNLSNLTRKASLWLRL